MEGRARLYARCAREGLPHQRCGKLVVAQGDDERARLEALLARGQQNGAGELRLLDAAEVRRLEPNVRASAALWSPDTGIVDAAELVASYRREALAHGAVLSVRTRVLEIAPGRSGLRVATEARSGERTEVRVPFVVNAAGLDADRVAASAGLDIDALGYRLHLCKGDYFTLAPGLRGLVSHLIYPLPARAGLGIHVTLDLAGGLRAGPDTAFINAPYYDVDPGKAPLFGEALRRYLPRVRDEDLQPDYAGIRPKLQAPDGPPRDFVIEEASLHGAPGLVNLIGIESPGLTASEAIAERVAALAPG